MTLITWQMWSWRLTIMSIIIVIYCQVMKFEISIFICCQEIKVVTNIRWSRWPGKRHPVLPNCLEACINWQPIECLLWIFGEKYLHYKHTYKCTYIHKYSQVPLLHGIIYHHITYDTAITVAKSKSDIRITTDNPYVTVTGELWGIYCEELGENGPWYNGTALHYRCTDAKKYHALGYFCLHWSYIIFYSIPICTVKLYPADMLTCSCYHM